MPAGDLIIRDGQIELLATLMGDGTMFRIDRKAGGVRGLRAFELAYAETPWAHADGSFIGEIRIPARTITVALTIKGASVAATNTNLDQMVALWGSSQAEDVPLHLQLPGMTKCHVMGRPVGIIPEEEQVVMKHVPALAFFRLADPTIYTP
jgi:hypothetical protein